MCVPQTIRLIELLKPTTAAGIDFGEMRSVYQHAVSLEIWRTWSDQRRSVCDCFADVIRAWRGDYVNTTPLLCVSNAAHEWATQWLIANNADSLPLVAINPGAGGPLKRWSLNRYLELADMLKVRGYRSLFIFGPKETALQAEAMPRIDQCKWLSYSSSDSHIQSVSALLQKCALTISNDCAVMHISAAVGTRTLGIFGPSISEIWFPYQQPWNQTVEHDVKCREDCLAGCNERGCLQDISVSEVFERAMLMVPKC